MCQKPNSVGIRPLKPTPTFNNNYGDMVDACMADFLQKLANDGFITVFSCCGHGIHGPYLVALFDCFLADMQIKEMLSRLEAEHWKDVYWVQHNYTHGLVQVSFYGQWNGIFSKAQERKITRMNYGCS